MTCVSMGNPHAIVYVDEMIDDETMAKIGPLFEHHERFPRRVNTEFVKVLDRERVQMRVWERGTGETLALRDRCLCRYGCQYLKRTDGRWHYGRAVGR